MSSQLWLAPASDQADDSEESARPAGQPVNALARLRRYAGFGPAHRLGPRLPREVGQESSKSNVAPATVSRLPSDGHFTIVGGGRGGFTPEFTVTPPNNAVRVEGRVDFSMNSGWRGIRRAFIIQLLGQDGARITCDRRTGELGHNGRFRTTFGGLPPGRYAVVIDYALGRQNVNFTARGTITIFNLPERRRRRHGVC